jgi:hypothetical protein
MLGRLREKELLEPILTGALIVSLATLPGPLAQQMLVDGAIADAVLALDGDSLVYVIRPDGLPKTPRRNLADLLAVGRAWSTTVLVEGSEARGAFDAAVDEVRAARCGAGRVGHRGGRIGSATPSCVRRSGSQSGCTKPSPILFADAVAAWTAQLLVHKACWAIDSGRRCRHVGRDGVRLRR